MVVKCDKCSYTASKTSRLKTHKEHEGYKMNRQYHCRFQDCTMTFCTKLSMAYHRSESEHRLPYKPPQEFIYEMLHGEASKEEINTEKPKKKGRRWITQNYELPNEDHLPDDADYSDLLEKVRIVKIYLHKSTYLYTVIWNSLFNFFY